MSRERYNLIPTHLFYERSSIISKFPSVNCWNQHKMCLFHRRRAESNLVVEIRTAASTVCKPHCPLCKNFAYAQCINYGGRCVHFWKLLFIGLKLALISRQPIKLCVTSDGRGLHIPCFGARAGPITSRSLIRALAPWSIQPQWKRRIFMWWPP